MTSGGRCVRPCGERGRESRRRWRVRAGEDGGGDKVTRGRRGGEESSRAVGFASNGPERWGGVGEWIPSDVNRTVAGRRERAVRPSGLRASWSERERWAGARVLAQRGLGFKI